jgi:hypothetical protein
MTSDPLLRFLAQRSARVQRRARLRLLGSGELSDAAVSIYQELGGPILKNTAISTLLSLASIIFVFAYVLPSLGITTHPGSVKAQVSEAAFAVGLALIVGGPLLAIGLGFTSAFVTGLASDYMNGQFPNPKAHLASARKLLPKIVGLGLFQTFCAAGAPIFALIMIMISALVGGPDNNADALATITAAVAMFACFFGVFAFPIVLARQILILPIMVIEGLGLNAARKRNRELMKAQLFHPSGYGHATTISFLTYFLVVVIWGGVGTVIGLAEPGTVLNEWLRGNAAHDLALAVVQYLPLYVTLWTVIPVWCAGATLLYFERRTRIEGDDVEALARDLGKHVKKNRFEL